jgi:hypothetical protein
LESCKSRQTYFAIMPWLLGIECGCGASPLITEPWRRLRVDVVDDEGTSYSVTYFKRASPPQLLARNISHTHDRRTPVELSDFLARAWQAANEKARELGWIV